MKKLFLLFLTLSFSLLTFSQNYYSITSGSWTDNTSVWSTVSQTGTACLCNPGSTISGSTTVYIYNNIASAPSSTGAMGLTSLSGSGKLIIEAGDSAIITASSLSLTSGSSITVYGTLFIYAPLTMANTSNITINSGGNVYIYGNVSLSNSATVTDNGSLTIHGNVTTSGSASFSGSGTSYVIGSLSGAGTSFLSILPSFFSSFNNAMGSGLVQFNTSQLRFVPLQFNSDPNSVLTGNGAFTSFNNLTIPTSIMDTAKISTILPLPGDSLIRMGAGGSLYFSPLGPGCRSMSLPPGPPCSDRIMTNCGAITFGGYNTNYYNVKIGIGINCPLAALHINTVSPEAFYVSNAASGQSIFNIDNKGNTNVSGTITTQGNPNNAWTHYNWNVPVTIPNASAIRTSQTGQYIGKYLGFGMTDDVGVAGWFWIAQGQTDNSEQQYYPMSLTLDQCGFPTLTLAQSGWCDYVFAEGYKPLSIKEKEKYYQTNKHLPDIDPEGVVTGNGLNVTKNIKGIVKNIEEDRLDITSLYKLIQQQQQEIELLKQQISALQIKN